MTDQNYAMALTEVDIILDNTEPDLVAKIPNKMRELIKSNMSKEYKPNIDYTKPISKQNLKKETEAILSLIFRSYWATEEEKKELEEKAIKEQENLKKETEVIFPHQVKTENMQVAIIDELPWYKKFCNKILKILRI